MAKVDIGELVTIAQQVIPLLEKLFGLFKRKTPPVTPVPAPGPIDTPAGPLPQTPIPVPARRDIAHVVLKCTSVEKPARVGGGPGVNYESHERMIAESQAFNFGAVTFWNGQARDMHGDEFLGADIVAADLEFRTEYRVYSGGRLVAVMKGEGDTDRHGEGSAAPWHQSESAGVGFGVSRWLNSAGFDNRIKFHEEGTFEVELIIGGVASNRVALRFS